MTTTRKQEEDSKMKTLIFSALIVLTATLAACGNSAAVDHGECHMQALQAPAHSSVDQVNFVDACMKARGYESKTGFSDPLCDGNLGVRTERCYMRPSIVERVKAQFR